MRLLVSALVFTFVVAVVAASFAIWPVVANAPWEYDAPAVVDDGIGARCEAALRLREATMAAAGGQAGLLAFGQLEEKLADAREEIVRYC